MKSFGLFCLGLFCLWPVSGRSKALPNHKQCFSNHIQQALQINSKRKKLYHKLSHGQSDLIYTELMTMERLTLKLARWIDQRAEVYHNHGMNLFCSEFLPMQEKDLDTSIPENPGREFDWKKYQRPLTRALKANHFDEVRRLSLDALVELKDGPQFHCLSRHFFESIYRFAYFAPKRMTEAKALHLKSPKKMLKQIIQGHILGLWFVNHIDKKAMPLQMQGIPMLCHELPELLNDIKLDELRALKEQ